MSTKIVGIILLAIGAIEMIISSTCIAYSYLGLKDWEPAGAKEAQFRDQQLACSETLPSALYCFNTSASACPGGSSSGSCGAGTYCVPSSGSVSTSRDTCTDCQSTASMYADDANTTCAALTGDALTSCTQKCGAVAGLDSQQCGVGFSTLACSGLTAAAAAIGGSIVGFICGCIAGVVGLLVAIPTFFNGLWSVLDKEVLARGSGGVGLTSTLCGFLSSLICFLVMWFSSAIAAATSASIAPAAAAVVGTGCTSACKTSSLAFATLAGDVSLYFSVVTGLICTLLILSFLSFVVSLASCCMWKNRSAM